MTFPERKRISEEAASGMVPEGVKDYGIEGEDEPGSEADREESRSGHKPEHKKAFDAADQHDEVVELNEPGEKSLHPHRMKCMAASKYLKSMSQVEPYQFHPDHKALAMEHHKAIDPIGDEEDAVNTNEPASNTQDVPPGQMGEKALKKLKQEQIKQRSQMIEVNKKIAALYNALK